MTSRGDWMRRIFVGAVALVGCLVAVTGSASADVPTNITPPSILSSPPNTAEYGEQLVDGGGTWTPSVTPSVIDIQWEDCDAAGQGCVSIAGATQQSYTLQASDVGHTV